MISMKDILVNEMETFFSWNSYCAFLGMAR